MALNTSDTHHPKAGNRMTSITLPNGRTIDASTADSCVLLNHDAGNFVVPFERLFDESDQRRGQPELRIPGFADLLDVDGTCYVIWRHRDRSVELIPATNFEALPVGNVHTVVHGQKGRISQDYWIVRTDGGMGPWLGAC